ncbi:hypothetical protein NQ036_06770 [Brevibacterium sp. 91QC2O2]|uniref:hypothetical protein n=1 Tax=Brevibacterium sp. 91QC2O2 TaxID=2968458 RepID=UPI00211BA21A|nr:hypothetical protein [Brevibacterium sp. 91QC2O2]MCQ9367946.1 hypothetical protein [Brevibacterium sp. 91QC2O2]
MDDWSYFATRMNGDGTETRIASELPLSNPEVTTAVNGHGGIKGTISPEATRLQDSTSAPIFLPWSTAIYAEAPAGQIRGGGILTSDPAAGDGRQDLTIEATGHTGYLDGMPYTAVKSVTRGDPLATSWHMWEHTQARKGFNLGVTRTGTTKSRDVFLAAPDTVGTGSAQQVDPYVLAWYLGQDLGKEFEDMATLGGYEWTMTHAWSGEKILHRLVYGYPRLGKRRTDLRFVVGENVIEEPGITHTGDDYASHVLTLGAGEGTAMMRDEQAQAKPSRLGRYAIISDKTLTTPAQVKARGAAELKARTGAPDITDLTIIEHPNAPIGTYDPGDDIQITTARQGWYGTQTLWVKILTIVHHPDTGLTNLTVRRTDKVDQQ